MSKGHKHEPVAEPIGGNLFTPAFNILLLIFGIGFILTCWREVVGLGPATGLSDGYTWGLWKNFNVIVLTALGSGGYATALLFYVLGNKKFMPIARIALVTSLMGYTSGIIALTVDLGRPWNFWRIGLVQHWNLHSVLLEVAVCMSAYVGFLFLENAHPLFEKYAESDVPWQRSFGTKWLPLLEKIAPWVVAACIVLPSMHQSSLGSLFLLAGPRLHMLWQTPMVPLLFIISAHFLGYACIVMTVILSAAVWKRSYQMDALEPLGKIMSWVILGWAAIRVIDVVARGQLRAVFAFDLYSIFFLLELVLLLWGAVMMLDPARRQSPKAQFLASFLVALGGMLYRFNTTTTAFMPGSMWSYFPSVVETLICAGYIALGVIGYIWMVKRLPVMPIADARARH